METMLEKHTTLTKYLPVVYYEYTGVFKYHLPYRTTCNGAHRLSSLICNDHL
jgi:hypothetical protein